MRRIFLYVILIFYITSVPCVLFALSDTNEGSIKWKEKRGPGQFSLGSNIASITIEDGCSFIESNNCAIFKDSIGDIPTQKEIGIVVPAEENKENWFIEFNYNPIGYVIDDISSIMDSDRLLAEAKLENEKAEELRKLNKIDSIKILDWGEKIKYNSDQKTITWSFIIESNGKRLISYNARFLSFNGYTSATLVTEFDKKEKVKPIFQKLTGSFAYTEPFNYDKINPLKDKISNFNLASMISGKETGKNGFIRKCILITKKFGLLVLGIIIGIDIIRRVIKNMVNEEY